MTLKPRIRNLMDVGEESKLEEFYTSPVISLSAPQLLAVKQFLSTCKQWEEGGGSLSRCICTVSMKQTIPGWLCVAILPESVTLSCDCFVVHFLIGVRMCQLI